MRKLCQKEEFLNNIELLNFSKKIKKEYSTEYSLEYSKEYSIQATNSKLPCGRLGGRHVAGVTSATMGAC